jgi:hypothetical protein
MAMQKEKKAESGVTFGDKPSFATEQIFEYAPSDDGKAFTITFSGLEVSVGNTKAPGPPVAAREFSIVVPVSGYGPVKTVVGTTAFAMTSKGATGALVVTVNGNSKVFPIASGFDEGFVHTVDLAASEVSEMRISLQLLVERDSAFPDAVALITINAIDADLAPAGGKA